MKISKDRLKQIVQEELSVGFVGPQMAGGSPPRDPDGYEGRMAKQNLWKIAKYAQEMHDMIGDDENLEPWVEEKIAVASFMMDSVGHYMEYEKHREHEDAEGQMGHADFPSEEEVEISIEPEGEEEEYEFDLGDDEEMYDMDSEGDDEEEESDEEREEI